MHRRLISDGAAVALVRLLGIGLGFLVTVVIGRQLGPSGLGAYGYALVLLALSGVPVANGWAALVLRKSAVGAWGEVRGLLQRGWQLALSLAVLFFLVGHLAVGVLGVAPLVAGGSAAISLLAFVLLCDQLGALRLSVLRGLNHPVLGQLRHCSVLRQGGLHCGAGPVRRSLWRRQCFRLESGWGRAPCWREIPEWSF